MAGRLLVCAAAIFTNCREIPATASELLELFRAPIEERLVQNFVLSPTGKYLATYAHVEGSRNRPNYIYDIGKKSRCSVLEIGQLRFAISADGRTLATHGGGKAALAVQRWSDDVRWSQVLDGPLDVSVLALSSDASSIAYGTSEGTFLQRLDSDRKVKVGDGRMLYGDLCFSGDGKRLAVSQNGTITVIDPVGSETLLSESLPTHCAGYPSLSNDGSILAAIVCPADGHFDFEGRELWVWDTKSRKRIDHFQVTGNGFSTNPVLSADGTRVAVTTHVRTSDTAIRTYNVGRGNLAVYELPSADVLKQAPNCGYVHAVFGESDRQIIFATSGAAVLQWTLSESDRVPFQE